MPKHIRILLIEDNPDDAELIRATLEKSNGYILEIVRVETMRDIIRAINEKNFDVIVCDFKLPGFDATAVLNLMNERRLDVPFVLISGSVGDNDAHKAILMGADEYVSKDELYKLIAVIRRELKISSAYDETLAAFVRALEFRDNETAGHSERVVELTRRVARLWGLPQTVVLHMARGALLHDIGKLKVPDAVLLKPGSLTEEEMTIMRQHPIHSREILSAIPFLQRAMEIPHYHHERWDGSGYPYGLEGNDIPLSARIFAVVDVWDAMTSDRPYRKAIPQKEVLVYLKEQSGKLFDPAVIRIFLEMMEVNHE